VQASRLRAGGVLTPGSRTPSPSISPPTLPQPRRLHYNATASAHHLGSLASFEAEIIISSPLTVSVTTA
jgi:hypothetical protein